jgi:SynChlorMet cassette protein ScmC
VTSGAVGVLLAAHSGVGKTTASNRLPAPWVALCDDTTLIIRDDAGAYWAHPMPTWSHIFREEKITSWDTQTAIPLRAIFFLRQAEADRALPLGAAHAVGFLLERAQEPTEYWRENLSLAELGAFNLQLLDNLCDLLRAVPCYLLDARLDGTFWEEMEVAVQVKDER